jgi:hypothetical protein
MNFKVPQFIERETKIIGPLTFRQFGFVGTGGFLFFILYSFSSYINSTLFILLTLIIAGIFGSFAFLKIEGHPLPVLFNSFISFAGTPRTYLWERKNFTSKISQEIETKKEEKENDYSSDIKIFKQSRLKDLSSKIEIKD